MEKIIGVIVGYFIDIIAFSPLIVWLFGIYYCRRVAIRLNISKKQATLSGIFLPVVSVLIYFFYSYRNSTKEVKDKIVKIITVSLVSVSIIFAGWFYYITGTPEYSLYKLRNAIVRNEKVEVEKYLNIESVAENFGESSAQSQEWIDSMNTSILEIKEENPDKSKDAEAYVSTELSGKYLKNALATYSNNGTGNAEISLSFNDEGSKLFAEITKRNIDKKLAIFLSGNLLIDPVVQTEITNGQAVINGNYTFKEAKNISDFINTEKISTLNGFKIRKSVTNKDNATITIGKTGNDNGFDLIMTKADSRYWVVNKINTVMGINGNTLPTPEGERTATFDWKYKGKNYTLNEQLYDSYYKFYNSLPAQSVFNGESLIGELEKKNQLFIDDNFGDKSISELAQTVKSIGEKNKLSENQIVELVSSFVQTIPYDYEEFNNRATVTPKVDYPYEVLYKNKGICSDKSYLAYSLLRDLGYGVAFFLFPEDQHIAIGVKCPLEYSNYDSGYCFIETTSLGNKIGSSPNLSKEFGTATSKIELSDFSNDSTESDYSPLGKIEILNKIDGLSYTGVIDTFNTQKELDNLMATVRGMDRELNASRNDLKDQDSEVGKMVDKLNKLSKSSDASAYDEYNNLYSKYKKTYSSFEKDRKDFNAKIATRNQINTKYNNLLRSFYQ